MNIGLFSDTFYPEINGVATSVYSLFNLLKKRGHNCYVITTGDDKNVTFSGNVIHIPGIKLKHLYDYKASPIFSSEAYRIIETLHLDIIHVNTEFFIGQFGFISASKLGIPVVYTYHTMNEDYTYYATKGYFDRFSKWTIREFDRSCMLRANEIIAPSEKTLNYLEFIGIEKYINIVPTGFDFARFTNVTKKDPKVKEIQKKYNLGDKKVLLCLGRMAKEKSFDAIIKFYKKYLDQYNDKETVLLFVGNGPQKEELENLSEDLGISKKCIFVGNVPLEDTPYYYKCADVFLSASTSETQGLTFMEAMASKLPILCRFDNNLIGIIDNNTTGFFFLEASDFIYKLHNIVYLSNKESEKI